MTDTTQVQSKPAERAPEVAVAPLDIIDQQDIGAGAAAFDAWLRKISGDYVTLERLGTVAGSLPVIGNIMALIDAVMDIVGMIQKTIARKEIDFLQWVSLGINLIGVVPVPPAMGAARMSLRPALHLARQKLASGTKDIGAALVEVLIMHLNARLAGEIETFVDSAMAKLAGILNDCADTADGIADDLVKILNRCIGKEPLFDVGSAGEMEDKLYDPKVTSSWRRMLGALGRQYKQTANYVVAAAASQLPERAVAGVTDIVGHLTDFKPAFRGKLAALADEQAPMSIRWILLQLRDAVSKHRRRYPALVPSSKGANHKKNKPGHELGSIGKQKPATGDANACKLCPAKGGTARSISFATGAETFTHTDFVLDAPVPIDWSRTYRSQLSAYDHGNLGACWLTPYSTRIDVVGKGKPAALLYHAADGRSHRYPYLGVGQRHHDPVEQITLTRMSPTLLTLDFGKPLPEGEPSPWRETYELVDTVRAKAAEFDKEHFRLVALHARDGAALGLRYDHVVATGPYPGEEVLSDIISKQGETVVAHGPADRSGRREGRRQAPRLHARRPARQLHRLFWTAQPVGIRRPQTPGQKHRCRRQHHPLPLYAGRWPAYRRRKPRWRQPSRSAGSGRPSRRQRGTPVPRCRRQAAGAHRPAGAHDRLSLHHDRTDREAHRRAGSQPALSMGRARPPGRAAK